MIPRQKYRPIIIGLGFFVLLIGALLIIQHTPQARFRDFFADLSIDAPGYQTLFEVTHPSFVLMGDYCTLEFSQSSNQFREFIAKLGASEESILSSSGVWVRVNSKIDPEYP